MGEDIVPPPRYGNQQGEQSAPKIHLVESIITDPSIQQQAIQVSQGMVGDDLHEVSPTIPTTAVVDESKAWDMAHASHEARTDAAELRSAADNTDKFYTAIKNIDTEKIFEAKKWFGENPDKSPSLQEQARTVNEAYDEESVDSKVAQELREEAKIIDSRADNIEKWAGILHDHPVSDEYCMKYPEVEFSASNLADMEELNEDDAAYAESLESDLDKLTGMDVINGSSSDDGGMHGLEELVDSYSGSTEYEAILQSWNKLRANRDTSLGQIKDFYDDLYRKAFIAPRKARVSIMNNLFKEVASGQASVSSVPEKQNFDQ
jgi:hypothetical protein